MKFTLDTRRDLLLISFTENERTTTNPRDYPDESQSPESRWALRRGMKLLTIDVDGLPFTFG
jgi:hypothetical protein